MPNNLTRVERKRVKKVKLKIKPVTMPYGRRRLALPGREDERMIGKIGRIQGERMVMIPAKKAKA
jgi:hypothetical protein